MHRRLIVVVLLGIAAGCGGGITSDLADNYDTLMSQGWSRYNQAAYEDAYQLFLDARAFDVTRPDAYIASGWTLLRRQHPDSAVVVFKTVFPRITELADSVEALTGLLGSYLAAGEHAKVDESVARYPVSDLSAGFPFTVHDLFLDEDDVSIIRAMAFYRLGKYTSVESTDPYNALYHLNQVLSTPHEYVDPQTFMRAITGYTTGGGFF